jgi:hypothetical protein
MKCNGMDENIGVEGPLTMDWSLSYPQLLFYSQTIDNLQLGDWNCETIWFHDLQTENGTTPNTTVYDFVLNAIENIRTDENMKIALHKGFVEVLRFDMKNIYFKIDVSRLLCVILNKM